MIIKLNTMLTYARHRTEKMVKPLTLKEKINADRLFMAILLMLCVVGAIIFI